VENGCVRKTWGPPALPASTVRFVSDRGDARLRLDQVIVRRATTVSGLTRNQAQHWIESGAVLIAGEVVQRCATRVPEGVDIEVTLPGTARLRQQPQAESLSLNVLFEDEWLMAIDKPPGMVVHPSYKNPSGTLMNGVLWKIRQRDGLRPGPVTRLDKDTSGVVLVALADGIHAAVQRDMLAGLVKKEYLAVTCGVPKPPRGLIAMPLVRDPQDRRRVVAINGGPPSKTRYEVLTAWDGHAIVRCELLTGRTHQIRVHLASKGWPIVGDRAYGVPHDRLTRQALHSWRITLPHPVTRDMLAIEAPLPCDLSAVVGNTWGRGGFFFLK
jgi:23S rRNA pseudouridine1911/1915/1917 synthase